MFPKQFWSPKNFVPKKFGSCQDVDPKKIWAPKKFDKFRVLKLFGSQKFLGPENFGILGPRKFRSQKIWVQKNFESKKFLVPKKFGSQNFWSRNCFEEPAKLLYGTFQTPSRHPPDAFQEHSRHPSFHPLQIKTCRSFLLSKIRWGFLFFLFF